jgi:hypothetical protein
MSAPLGLGAGPLQVLVCSIEYRAEPRHERPRAWFVWTAACAAMMTRALIEELSRHPAIGFFALSGAPRSRRAAADTATA